MPEILFVNRLSIAQIHWSQDVEGVMAISVLPVRMFRQFELTIFGTGEPEKWKAEEGTGW